LAGEVADQLRLLSGRDVLRLHELQGLGPVVAAAQLARRLFHALLAPRELALRDRDQLLGRVRDHLPRELRLQALASDRRPHEALRPLLLLARLVAQEGAVALELLVRILPGLVRPPREQ